MKHNCILNMGLRKKPICRKKSIETRGWGIEKENKKSNNNNDKKRGDPG